VSQWYVVALRVIMADILANHEIVTKFLLTTCSSGECLNLHPIQFLRRLLKTASVRGSFDDDAADCIPVITGSVAEFYIKPMLTCIGDVDIMYHRSDELAIPVGTAPPTNLPPDEFHSRVRAYEIVDSEFPGYVYLVSSYLLTECIDDGRYNAVECQREFLVYEVGDGSHGPALVSMSRDVLCEGLIECIPGSSNYQDLVYCMRSLSWPPQAADWPTRHRNYGWPDSATVDRVVGNGCDVVQVAHRQCRRDEWMRRTQHRLSFSRAEIVLINSWMPVQQIVYHMFRVFFKTERFTDSAGDADAATLSNYHIKTLILWSSELQPRSWWIDDLNVVRLFYGLLRTLAVWLTDARCPHYFVSKCNLFDHPDNWYCSPLLIASRFMSETEASLAEWFINHYIRRLAQHSTHSVSRLFNDVSNTTKLDNAVSAMVDWRFKDSLQDLLYRFESAQGTIIYVFCFSQISDCAYMFAFDKRSNKN